MECNGTFSLSLSLWQSRIDALEVSTTLSFLGNNTSRMQRHQKSRKGSRENWFCVDRVDYKTRTEIGVEKEREPKS
jgi:hypothetical protein